MIGPAFVTFVLIGTSYAAYIDLKTSEVSDAVSLIIGGGSILFYLFHSLSRPLLTVTAIDVYLLVAAGSFAASVAMFLRLYRSLAHIITDATGRSMDWMNWLDAEIGPVDRADVVAGTLFGVAGGAAVLSVLTAGITPLVLSLLSGTALFGLGWSMYLMGLWGGADAFVLGAVGYAFPYLPVGTLTAYTPIIPVPLSLLMLVFAVGAVYSIVYAIYMALQDGEAMTTFWQQLQSEHRRVLGIVGGYLIIALVLGQVVHVLYGVSTVTVLQHALQFLVILAALLVLHQFLRVVEDDVMRQTIAVDDLEPGDVLAEEIDSVEKTAGERIVGLTPEQVARVQDTYETVDIRTGVRFIVAFPLAILLLLVFGDPFYAITIAL